MAMNIARRVRKAEQKLNTDREPMVVNVVHLGDGPLPPDEWVENTLAHHIPYQPEAQ